jgi:hypothetical protein
MFIVSLLPESTSCVNYSGRDPAEIGPQISQIHADSEGSPALQKCEVGWRDLYAHLGGCAE